MNATEAPMDLLFASVFHSRSGENHMHALTTSHQQHGWVKNIYYFIQVIYLFLHAAGGTASDPAVRGRPPVERTP